MKIDKTKYVSRFCDEATEHLKKISDGLVQLEKAQDDSETLNVIFRSAHTIKGSGRMIGLSKISEVAHQLEDILDSVKKGELRLKQAQFNMLFGAVDATSAAIVAVRQTQNDSSFDHEPVLKSLADILREEGSPGNIATAKQADTPRPALLPASAAQPEPPPFFEPNDLSPSPPAAQQAAAKADETLRISAAKLDETIKIMGEIISSQSRLREHGNTLESILKSLRVTVEAMPENISNSGHEQEVYGKTKCALATSLNTIRQFLAEYKNDVAYQSILTDQLMERGARLRMLPISTILDAFPRYARDIAVACGKSIELRITGGETELDKKIVENIGDPLMHMIRNCIDHGIESAEQRKESGKPETGCITIAAGYEGGSVFVHVSDDGGGIPLDKIRQKAIDKRIFSPEALSQMSESDTIKLIFRPGFSTSSFITDISGRGVGMDVVYQNVVEQLKGSIVVSTEAGKGTGFHINLPLTLAMIRVFFVSLGDRVFGVMVSTVEEVMKLKKADIIDIVDKKAIRLREQLVPLVELSALVGLTGQKHESSDELNLVVLNSSGEKLAVVVDSMISEEDMEIKPLPRHMKHVPLVSGVALTGKNEIALVLNTPQIFSASRNMSVAKSSSATGANGMRDTYILVADDSVNTREIEKSILESYGYKVDVAADGMEAYERAQNFNYDLIVTDVEMPVLDGLSLTGKLRQNARYKHTPIIIVSSREREEDKRKGVQAGANAYIVKGSFEQSNLLETVRVLLDAPKPD